MSATTDIMLQRLANSSDFTIENKPQDPSELSLELPFDSVQPNYFQTMGIQLLKGRAFTAQDGRDSPRVAIVNETFVKRYFPNEDPIGKRFTFGDGGPDAQWITIVGVVRDTKRQGAGSADQNRILDASTHRVLPRSMEVVLRTTGDPLALSKAVREAVWSIDRDLPIPRMQTMEQNLSDESGAAAIEYAFAWAVRVGGFGSGGGRHLRRDELRGHTTHARNRHPRGAGRSDPRRAPAGRRRGNDTGAGGRGHWARQTFALTRLMASLLFGVSATDPLTFAAIAALLFGVALLACWIPARRATKVDPMVALRYE